jgi:hypothetical protein
VCAPQHGISRFTNGDNVTRLAIAFCQQSTVNRLLTVNSNKASSIGFQ